VTLIGPADLSNCSRIHFLKIQNGKQPPFSKPLMQYLYNHLTDFNKILNTITYYFTLKTAKIIKTKLPPVSVFVKATTIKQQKSKLCPHILSTEPRFYIL